MLVSEPANNEGIPTGTKKPKKTPVVVALPPLSLLDMALMAVVRGSDKRMIVGGAIATTASSETSVPAATQALNRLIDLGLVQLFGDDYMVTPRGQNALRASVQSAKNVLGSLARYNIF